MTQNNEGQSSWIGQKLNQIIIVSNLQLNHTKQKIEMSLFCDSSSQTQPVYETEVDSFSSRIFSQIMESKDSIKLQQDQYALHLPQIDSKLTNGITTWFFSHQLTQLTIKVALQLKNVKKMIEKRLPDILNKEFKLTRITYQKPKLTFMCKLSMSSKPNSSNLLQKEISQITNLIKQVVNRIKELEREQEKFEPFMDLYAMRECFEFTRSSRSKASKISLKSKRMKNVTQVLKLISLGEVTLNRLESVYIQAQIKRYEQQKKKITNSLQQLIKIKDRKIDQAILTSIDIIDIKQQKLMTFANQNPQDLLSIISTAVYTFRKQITIHKQSNLQSLSNQIFTEILVKKEKTQKGTDSFQNQIKLLTHLKGTYHPYIAQYFCKLQECPFKSQALFIKYYNNSLGKIKQNISSDKKLRILYQIGKLINFLNYRRICHRDLKLDNIMIDDEMNPKIIDWGSVCGMHSNEPDSGTLKVKDQRLFATEGYFQRYYEDVFHEPFGKNYTRDEIEKGQYFDIYSFGFIIQKVFDLKNSDLSYWLDVEMDYVSKKCREKNPSDRLSAVEVEIYLTLLRKKMKKFQEQGLSSPVSSNS